MGLYIYPSTNISTNQPAISVTPGVVTIANLPTRIDYGVTNVSTAAYTTLIASASNAITKLQIFDSSGQTLVLATGTAGSEVNKFFIFPGGVECAINIAAGTRLSIKAVSANATVGEISVNIFG